MIVCCSLLGKRTDSYVALSTLPEHQSTLYNIPHSHTYKHFFLCLSACCLISTQTHTPKDALESKSEDIWQTGLKPPDYLLYPMSYSNSAKEKQKWTLALDSCWLAFFSGGKDMKTSLNSFCGIQWWIYHKQHGSILPCSFRSGWWSNDVGRYFLDPTSWASSNTTAYLSIVGDHVYVFITLYHKAWLSKTGLQSHRNSITSLMWWNGRATSLMCRWQICSTCW